MSKNGRQTRRGKRNGTPAFLARAEGALGRAGTTAWDESRNLGLSLIGWKNDRLGEAKG
jgi:hypothetical protein